MVSRIFFTRKKTSIDYVIGPTGVSTLVTIPRLISIYCLVIGSTVVTESYFKEL